ncbi:hypothetical protein KSS93_20965 [Pseudomonas xanthosomatis]|uniref:hypothetical protein n=1 Tax=Pseudomonas xanthosomatis TaxID=2842356 RepID=UPI001C3DB96D|nr:hypothetical protein [Pseudomonas xanthosomatis]QXH45327.1 hypothetical protein KSS93_20965 [Pseudomonas xanthosomatis]
MQKRHGVGECGVQALLGCIAIFNHIHLRLRDREDVGQVALRLQLEGKLPEAAHAIQHDELVVPPGLALLHGRDRALLHFILKHRYSPPCALRRLPFTDVTH